MINGREFIAGIMSDCNCRKIKSILDCETQKIIKQLGRESKIEIMGENETKNLSKHTRYNNGTQV